MKESENNPIQSAWQASEGIRKWLKISASVWKYPQVTENIRKRLKVSASIWTYPQASQSVRKCLKVSANAFIGMKEGEGLWLWKEVYVWSRKEVCNSGSIVERRLAMVKWSLRLMSEQFSTGVWKYKGLWLKGNVRTTAKGSVRLKGSLRQVCDCERKPTTRNRSLRLGNRVCYESAMLYSCQLSQPYVRS